MDSLAVLKKRAKQNSAGESAPKSEGVSKDPELTNEFTKITLLLDLLIFLNQGNSVSKFQSFTDSAEDHHPLLALATILVVDHEIIAARYSLRPELVSFGSVPDGSPSTNSSLQATRSSHTLQVAAWRSTSNGDYSSAHESGILDTKNAEGFWDKVQTDQWYCAQLVELTLANHAKTVVDYLNAYRKASQEEQEEYAGCFSSYLLTTCWKKMHSRIISWPAVGLIRGLYFLLIDDTLEEAIRDFAWDSLPTETGRGDRTLCNVLSAAAATTDVISNVTALLSEKHRSITKLLEVVHSPEGHNRIYNKDTVLDFHRLLVATLIGWAQSLEALKLGKMNRVSTELQIRCFKCLEDYARILTSILASASFATHMRFLLTTDLLSHVSPKLSSFQVYKRFAATFDLGFAPASWIPPATGEDDDYQENDPDIPSFMRTFIVHFLAKRTLEAHTDEFPEDVSLSIMALNRPPSFRLSWSEVESIILDVMSSGGVDPQTAVDKFKERIQGIEVEPMTKRGDVLQTFQAIVNGESNNGFSVGLHCEIMLATLGLEECPKTALISGDKEFETLCEGIGRNLNEISVSRRCCPVCWEFFKFLKDAGQMTPILPGCHSNFYPVELPPWTPTTFVKPMVERFRRDLRNELAVLATPKWVTSPLQNKGIHRRRIKSHPNTCSTPQSTSVNSQGSTGFKRLLFQANPFKG